MFKISNPQALPFNPITLDRLAVLQQTSIYKITFSSNKKVKLSSWLVKYNLIIAYAINQKKPKYC